MTTAQLPDVFDVKLQVNTEDLRYLEIYDDFTVSSHANDEDSWLVTAKDREFVIRIGIISLPSQALAHLACDLLTECAKFYQSATGASV